MIEKKDVLRRVQEGWVKDILGLKSSGLGDGCVEEIDGLKCRMSWGEGSVQEKD